MAHGCGARAARACLRGAETGRRRLTKARQGTTIRSRAKRGGSRVVQSRPTYPPVLGAESGVQAGGSGLSECARTRLHGQLGTSQEHYQKSRIAKEGVNSRALLGATLNSGLRARRSPVGGAALEVELGVAVVLHAVGGGQSPPADRPRCSGCKAVIGCPADALPRRRLGAGRRSAILKKVRAATIPTPWRDQYTDGLPRPAKIK